ncbi:DNA mismatch repair endonuclease MutL [Clostridium sp. YIM B02515]|uniref:DNA mismatch repair protein MutL n=1 Tax=Clostridium rhizosphaerae TaxID=2803861 RepID=A0ABS1T927_9CLOT|nr:DNA mismatch repair endonuclease MutL [Clostridium rhizosphaerae]MBL4934864.1 DNA mismatch repair endonuclease MutL [Clostridium rhizosphaerae]
MKRINVLDVNTSNKIAAGEVVERPFSVVKELIENSLDANSKNITVEIQEGGQKSIRIIDDGEGIHPEDIEKAFLPHATSKINEIDDIYKINTFGFRGEALASVAAVSNVILKSRTSEFEYGKEISISGGRINYFKDTGSNIGTTIEVNDLFYNVPARLKFMKSSQREAALINDIIQRLALVNSKVSFKALSNNNKVLFTAPSNNVSDTIRAIYGKNISDNITEIERHTDIASVYGYIGNSEISRGSRNNQSLFVNKRYVKNRLITTAVESAFKSFLTINKYPFFIIFLEIFPELIDINVHPTKSEIKFKDERFIFKLVFDTVHETLRKSLKDSFDIQNNDFESFDFGKEAREKTIVQVPIDLKSNSYKYENIEETATTYNSNIYGDMPLNNKHYNILSENNLPVIKEQEELSMKEAKFAELSVIGQFNDTYILAQSGQELYIIDQHAAHEKIMFEKFIKKVKESQVVAQLLSLPVVLEMSSEDFMIYSENKEIFMRTGFNIEIFGENTISIREVPIILGNIEVKNLFLNIIDNLKSMGSGETVEVKYDRIATAACKSAVKANNRLSMLEMNSLINELRFIDNPFTCPHGRPTIIKITLNELEKRFKRIQ